LRKGVGVYGSACMVAYKKELECEAAATVGNGLDSAVQTDVLSIPVLC
jgi:hypothetical protein